jgi:soluble lytic murein transglycosylase-like protein
MALSKRVTIAVASGTAAVVTIAGVWLLFGTGNGTPSTNGAGDPSLVVATSLTTDPPPTTTVPTTTVITTTVAPTTVPTTTRVRTKAPVAAAKAMPPPVKPPAAVPVPPPPHTTPAPGCTPTYHGTAAAHADVKSALLAAADTQDWSGVSNPPLVNPNPTDGTTPTTVSGPPAVITVPHALIEAIAWQESGWQSDIASCDGGNGAMQIQQATATWMNQRFGTSYDYTTLSGNAALGGEYLEWLISYFGENSFNHLYDMSDPDLVAAVIDAYNAGPNNVVFAGGHTVVSNYAATVEALMSQQPWND